MDSNQNKNLTNRYYSYEPCSIVGMCCECIRDHLRYRKLPACCFPNYIERTYNLSFERFAKLVSDGWI